MKIKLKTLSDKITAVVLYLICMTIVIAMFLEISYMADYGFYEKFQTTQETFDTLMGEKVDKEYADIEKYVLMSFEKQAEKKLKDYSVINGAQSDAAGSSQSESEKENIVYRSLCEKYQNSDKTNLIIKAYTNI